MNKTTRTIEVDLRFNEYDPRIKPGMFASIELVIQEEKNSFVIPKSCISNFNGKDSVLVIGNGNIAERREITTGIGNDLNIAVLSGLQEGDKVIIAGSATEGSKVRLVGESSENEEREIEDENISDGKMPDLTSGEKPDISFPNGDGKAPKDKAPKDKDQKDKTKDGKK